MKIKTNSMTIINALLFVEQNTQRLLNRLTIVLVAKPENFFVATNNRAR